MDQATATRARRVILAAVDYSDASGLALSSAVDFVRGGPTAELHILHVVTPAYRTSHEDVMTGDLPGEVEQTGRDARRELPKFYEPTLRDMGPNAVVVGHVRFGRPDHEIVLLAGEIGADLIVLGTHGKTKLERFLLGSTAERVLHAAPCAVLVVRAKEHAAETQLEADSDAGFAPMTFRLGEQEVEASQATYREGEEASSANAGRG